MQNTRRDFLKKAALLASGGSVMTSFPLSIQKAMAINPPSDSSFYDAEHVVLLMQENRSFDHLYGSLQGVRGFNDPRVIDLPDKNPAWLQSDRKGNTYTPFRLDIKDSKVTWMGSLPHSWTNQVGARNHGKYDRWLEEKRSGYDDMPFTLGYYERADLPFYYALADAFTVCDHHFCSSLTGTTPNRLYYWTGTLRSQQNGKSPANVQNSFVDYGNPARWKTFPERLEAEKISWKIYQNELSVGVGFKGEEDAWLGNFTDNPLEWFAQYHVRFSPAHIAYMKQRAVQLEKELQHAAPAEKTKQERLLKKIHKDLKKYNSNNFDNLPKHEQQIHKKAFTTNRNDPNYHDLTMFEYEDMGEKRQMMLPKGDVLHQFREDVQTGNLPTVSWLVGPQRFSDHPSSPWYGAWYVSEILDILTQNPEVWKKTIFIVTYDENDGYFDHLPPFTAPDPKDSSTGFCSKGIDTTVDYLTHDQLEALKGKAKDPEVASPIGLGYRVPFIVASPWSRGGWVNSQIQDNTSVLMFLEKFLSHKTGKTIREENISEWRRTICGDLTGIFRPYKGEKIHLPEFVKKKPFVESIFNARFKPAPSGFHQLTSHQIEKIKKGEINNHIMPEQEKGTRNACSLPYELYAYGKLSPKKTFTLMMKAGNHFFEQKAAGVPFYVYNMDDFSLRNYALKAGDTLSDTLPFQPAAYHFRLYGPNGFFREFQGDAKDPELLVMCHYETKRFHNKRPSGNLSIEFSSNTIAHRVEIIDNAYRNEPIKKQLNSQSTTVSLNLNKSHGWYDITVRIKGNPAFSRRMAGHVETGHPSLTDPFMGDTVV